MSPRKINIQGGVLSVLWDDGIESSIRLANLRFWCPCAICVEDKEKKGNGYIPFYSDYEITIGEIKQVGSYAIAVTWKDGHNTGIYNYGLLRNLTESELNK